MIGRRTLLAGLALLPAAAAANDAGLAAGCVGALLGALAALPPGPALLHSYLVQTGAGASDFDITQADAAYVYDNALAGLALLAAGHGDAARRIGAALAQAQGNDRHWHDGRLRNAYQAGPMVSPVRLPGWWNAKAGAWAEDPYQVGSEAGPVAWAMLLWAALGMAAPANAAGDWLTRTLRAANGYYGGFYGFEPDPLKLTWQSTEQNTDLAVAFARLERKAEAAHAARFVAAMFDPQAGRFDAGLSPAGTRNLLLAADAGIWPFLAGLGSAASAQAAVKALRRGAGIGFSAASGSAWPEGTAFAALAVPSLRPVLLAAVAGQISPSGYVYASMEPQLSTGLTVGPSLIPGQPEQPFDYFRRPCLSATAWAALAAMRVNPFAL